MNYIHRNCPVCDSTSHLLKKHFSKEHWKTVQCDNCSMVYIQNPPDYDTLSEEFEWSNNASIERKKRRKNRKTYYFFSDNAKKLKGIFRKNRRKEMIFIDSLHKSGNFLDIGCGDGGTLRHIDERYTPYGIEISSPLSKESNEYCIKNGGQVICADSYSGLQSFETSFFDIVLLRSYLEHEYQPLPVLKEVNRVLKKDGIVIIKVPNFSCWNRKLRGLGWPGFRFPDHVNYFTPKTLKKIIEESGLRIKKFSILESSPTSDNMWLYATKGF